MTTTRTDEPVRRAHELTDRNLDAWRAHDASAVVAGMAEDVRYQSPGLPHGAVRGRAAAMADVAATMRAFPDFALHEYERLVAPDGRVVMVHWRATGTFLGPLDPPGFAPTGAPVSVEGMTRTELRGDVVADFRLFYDLNDLARQIGAIPPPGSPGERMVVGLQRMRAAGARRRRR